MDLRLFVRGVREADELRAYAQERFESRLRRFMPRILSAVVRLEDQTGPRRNAVDKSCAITLTLRSGDIRIRELGADFPAVIDLALDRARAALGRHVGRRKRGVGEG